MTMGAVVAETAERGDTEHPLMPAKRAAGGAGSRASPVSRRFTPWKSLGVVYGQKFYGLLEPSAPAGGPDAKDGADGQSRFLPFRQKPLPAGQPFAALVNCRRPCAHARLKDLARQLLDKGCVELHAIGLRESARILSSAYDAWLDEDPYRRLWNAYSEIEGGGGDSPADRESMVESISWFILPVGHPTLKVLTVVGDESDFAAMVADFARVAGDLRESTLEAPADDMGPPLPAGRCAESSELM